MGKRHGRTNGWGTIAARAFSAAPGAVLIVALAGCSSELQDRGTPAELPAGFATDTQTSAQAPADDADRPAFHFASGDLVLGDFNYEDIAGNIFNPCEEISAEEFAAIGYESRGRNKRTHMKDLNSCFMDLPGDTSGLTYVLLGGSADLARTVEQGALVETGVSDVVPGVYAYGPIGIEDDICYAGVDTERGQFAVASGVGGVSGIYQHEELCKVSTEILEALYRL